MGPRNMIGTIIKNDSDESNDTINNGQNGFIRLPSVLRFPGHVSRDDDRRLCDLNSDQGDVLRQIVD